MRLREILSRYPEDSLDQLARDKLDEVANIRLPRSVLEQEIASALSSFSYIADVLAASHPPTYAFLKLLMEAPGHTAYAAHYRDAVMERTDRITDWVSSGEGLPPKKHYGLYRAILLAAWEEENRVDTSEARMLEALRRQLGITMREHLLLEHHPEVRPVWDSPRAYEHARNYLLARGLVLSLDDRYVLPDEVRVQVRRYWNMELHDADYRRLLGHLTTQDLRGVLEDAGLPVSGSKEERMERIVEGLVAPSATLDSLHINQLKDLARKQGLPVALPKSELISELIGHFDGPEADEPSATTEADGHGHQEKPTEHRERSDDHRLREVLGHLSGNQLYEILAGLRLPRSGSKSERVERLMASESTEPEMLEHLRRRDLARLCRKLGLRVSGPKDELIDRLLITPPRDEEAETDEEALTHVPMPTQGESGEAETQEPAATTQESPAMSSEVPGLEHIRRDFPDFQHDEQLMLALLREARSLNERDIQRLAARHDLGWLLPKGHMAELLHKLAMTQRNPVRVRSTGSANIYEWIEAPGKGKGEVDRWAARDVIDALRQGVVPEQHLDLLMVGQDAARGHLQEQLDYIGTGRSAFKFIRGAYGSGKSFISAWLRERALAKGFAVATVRVSAELSLADLSNFYTGLMEGLRTPEKRGASSFADILESWLLAVQRKTEQIEGLSARVPSQREKLTGIVSQRIQNELAQLSAHDPGLPPAVAAVYQARIEGNEEKAIAARAWLAGDRSLSSQTLRQIGVRGHLEPEQVLPRLRALLEILAGTHLQGLVVLIDELELVRRRPHKQTRDQAYETLRALIDEVGENRLPRCLLISTGTDTFFDDQRYGLASYEALAHRINPPQSTAGHRSIRQPVIELEGLSESRLRKVAERTRSLHEAAYGWPAGSRVSDEDLETLVTQWTTFGGESIERLPRPFLRQLVHILDLCEENADLAASECFTEPEKDPAAYDAILGLVDD